MEYIAYRKKYSKTSLTPSELSYRLRIFQSTLKKIKKHNLKKSSYKQGINQFSDLTWEEFKAGYLNQPKFNPDYVKEGEVVSDVDKIDWRTKGVVGEIQDQGQCGSCWSFSTTGAIQGALAIKTS